MTIVRTGAERIHDLKPLWQSLHDHHASMAPELRALGEVLSSDDSWAIRRKRYEEWRKSPMRSS